MPPCSPTTYIITTHNRYLEQSSEAGTQTTPTQSKSRRTGVIIAVVVAVIVVLAVVLEAPISAATCTTQGTVLVVNTTSVASTITSTTAVPIQQATTQTQQVYNIAAYTIPANQYVYTNSQLTTGMDVQVSWSAADTVDVYVFSSTQYAAYSNSGTTTPNIASAPTAQSGSLSFHVSATDTYYLVIFNPHNGFFGLGSHSVGLYSASGTATYQGTTTTYVTQTTTSVTYVPQQVTATETTTSTYQHTVNLLAQLGGSACSG